MGWLLKRRADKCIIVMLSGSIFCVSVFICDCAPTYVREIDESASERNQCEIQVYPSFWIG
jgi:hypothetical protein